MERRAEDPVEALIDGGLVPEIPPAILHPLEIAYRDAAGIRQDVGDDKNALVIEDGIRPGGRGAIRTFADDLRLDLSRIAGGDDVLYGRRDQHFDIERQQVLLPDRFSSGESLEVAMLLDPGEGRIDVQAFGVVDCAGVVTRGHDDHALLRHQLCGDRAYVTEPLDGDPGALDRELEVIQG